METLAEHRGARHNLSVERSLDQETGETYWFGLWIKDWQVHPDAMRIRHVGVLTRGRWPVGLSWLVSERALWELRWWRPGVVRRAL